MSQRLSTSDAYSKRFARFGGPSAELLSAVTESGNLTESFTTARAVAEMQRNNLKELMNTAEEMIAGITTFQQNAEADIVKNIPLPDGEIKNSAGKSYGYVRLSMRYLQSGFLHFMEQYLAAEERMEHLENHIRKMAAFNDSVEIHGELVNLDLSDLEGSNRPISPPSTPPVQAPKAGLSTEKTPGVTVKSAEEKPAKSDNKRVVTPTPIKAKDGKAVKK